MVEYTYGCNLGELGRVGGQPGHLIPYHRPLPRTWTLPLFLLVIYIYALGFRIDPFITGQLSGKGCRFSSRVLGSNPWNHYCTNMTLSSGGGTQWNTQEEHQEEVCILSTKQVAEHLGSILECRLCYL